QPAGVAQGGHPTAETGSEPGGAQGGEDAAEGIVRGDAIGQGQEALEEVALGMAEGLDVRPGLGPTDDGAEGKDEDVGQGVELGAVDARVGQVGEVVQQSQFGPSHGGSSGGPDWSRTLTEVRPQYLTSRKSLAFKGLRCADPGLTCEFQMYLNVASLLRLCLS